VQAVLGESGLENLIIEKVVEAEAAGTPIEAWCGERFDKNLKRQFASDSLLQGLHQSIICALVKRLVVRGSLRYEPGTDEQIVLGSREPKVMERPTRILRSV
jgi:hypothetical protein